MSEPQVMMGMILPNGELILDCSLACAPGRVRIVVTECPFDAEEASPWSRLEGEWRMQRAQYYQMTELAALQASKEAQPPSSTAQEKLTPAAADLRDCMSQISEDCYCAGWLGGLEYLLWTAVMNGPVEQGSWRVTQSEIDHLRLLARRCGGWVKWDDAQRTEIWLPIDEWLRQFDTYVAKNS